MNRAVVVAVAVSQATELVRNACQNGPNRLYYTKDGNNNFIRL